MDRNEFMGDNYIYDEELDEELNDEDDDEFDPDEFIIEDEETGLVFDLAELFQEHPRTSIINFKTLDKINRVDEVISRIAKLNKCRYARKDHHIRDSVSVIEIEGKDLLINDTAALAYAMRLSDVVDIAPKTSGNVEINFTFNDVTITLESEIV